MTELNNNKKLEKIFLQDQNERHSWKNNKVFIDKVRKNDIKRKSKVNKLLINKKLKTGNDFYNAAMIFQHGESIKDFRKAKYLSQKSMNLGFEKAKWLFAASTDRLLMFQGKKQKYGTQFQYFTKIIKSKKNPLKKKWILYKFDKRITDKTRAKFNVQPIKDSINKVSQMNKRLN